MPGGEADPHMTKADGTKFDFHGEAGKTYRMFECGDFRLDAAMAPLPCDPEGRRTVFGALTITVGHVRIFLPADHRIKITSRDVDVAVHSLGCSLPAHDPQLRDDADEMNAIPYINFDVHRHPDLAGASGVTIDGDDPGRTAADYEVPG